MMERMVVTRHSSPFVSTYDPCSSSSWGKRKAEQAAPSSSSLAAALREVREEMRLLDKKLIVLQDSKRLQNADARKEQVELELGEPISGLERDVEALRDAALQRFESVEERLKVLDELKTATTEQCEVIKKRRAEEELEAEARAAKRRSRRDTPERRQVADEQRSSRRRGSSPARTARARSNSPTPRRSKSHRNSETSHTVQSVSAATASEVLGNRCFVPDWAASAQLHEHPHPEGRSFTSIVDAYHAVCADEKIEPGQPVEMGIVAGKLRKLDPTIFQRFGKQRWKDLMPIAQSYVAMFLLLPPLQRELHRCAGEQLVLDVARPYFAQPCSPPTWLQQVAAVCQFAGVNPEAWIHRGQVAPTAPAPMPQPPQVSAPAPPPAAAALCFPRLEVALPPEWIARVEKSGFWDNFLDILRQKGDSEGKAISIQAVEAALTSSRKSVEQYAELLKMCGGILHFFTLALNWLRFDRKSEDEVALCNPLRPYRAKKHNDDYFFARAGVRRAM